MKTIELIKKYGETDDGKYYFVPGSQQCKLPQLFANSWPLSPVIFIELDGQHFFVDEMPGNINGLYFRVYYSSCASEDIKKRLRLLIKNNQDVIGISFEKVTITEV